MHSHRRKCMRNEETISLHIVNLPSSQSPSSVCYSPHRARIDAEPAPPQQKCSWNHCIFYIRQKKNSWNCWAKFPTLLPILVKHTWIAGKGQRIVFIEILNFGNISWYSFFKHFLVQWLQYQILLHWCRTSATATRLAHSTHRAVHWWANSFDGRCLRWIDSFLASDRLSPRDRWSRPPCAPEMSELAEFDLVLISSCFSYIFCYYSSDNGACEAHESCCQECMFSLWSFTMNVWNKI